MSCPFCKAQLLGHERYCDNCSLGLVWSPSGAASARMPDIRPGETLLRTSFSQAPLPGRPTRDEHRPDVCDLRGVPEGVLVITKATSTGAYTDFGHSYADACVRGTFTPYDPGTRLGLSARHAVLGGAQLSYALNLSLPAGLIWLSRNMQKPGFATSDPVGPVRTLTRAPSLGRACTLELRVQGPTLHALVDDEPVLVAHDPTFTCGAVGIRCGREPDVTHDVRVLCHGYDVRGVSA